MNYSTETAANPQINPKKVYMWYDWAMIVSFALYCVFRIINTVISTASFCKYIYYFHFWEFFTLFTSYIFPLAFALILPVIIIVLILEKTALAKDASYLFLLFGILESARSISFEVYDIKNNLWYISFVVAGLAFIFMMAVPFLKKTPIDKYFVCGAFVLCVILNQLANISVVTDINAYTLIRSFVFSTAYFTAAAFLLFDDKEPVIMKKTKPFGINFGSPLYVLIPCAISLLIGIIYIILQKGNGYNPLNAATVVQAILVSLLNLYIIIFFIIKLIQHFSANKKTYKASADRTAINNYATPGNFYADSRSVTQQIPLPSDFYLSLVLHIVLLLFTFGIYLLIWIYKTTERLNAVPGSEQRIPVNKLLLCMFVPFYAYYWFYKTAKIVDAFGTQCNNNSQISLAVLLLTIFLSPAIIPPIIIQNKMNNLYVVTNGQPVVSGF